MSHSLGNIKLHCRGVITWGGRGRRSVCFGENRAGKGQEPREGSSPRLPPRPRAGVTCLWGVPAPSTHSPRCLLRCVWARRSPRPPAPEMLSRCGPGRPGLGCRSDGGGCGRGGGGMRPSRPQVAARGEEKVRRFSVFPSPSALLLRVVKDNPLWAGSTSGVQPGCRDHRAENKQGLSLSPHLALAPAGPLGTPGCSRRLNPLVPHSPSAKVLICGQKSHHEAVLHFQGTGIQRPRATGCARRAAASRRQLRSVCRDLPQSRFVSRPPEPRKTVGHSLERDCFIFPSPVGFCAP